MDKCESDLRGYVNQVVDKAEVENTPMNVGKALGVIGVLYQMNMITYDEWKSNADRLVTK